MEGGGRRVEGGGWRVEGGGWRVEGGGWRVERGGWRVEGGGWRVEGGEWRVLGFRCRVLALLRRRAWEAGAPNFYRGGSPPLPPFLEKTLTKTDFKNPRERAATFPVEKSRIPKVRFRKGLFEEVGRGGGDRILAPSSLPPSLPPSLIPLFLPPSLVPRLITCGEQGSQPG